MKINQPMGIWDIYGVISLVPWYRFYSARHTEHPMENFSRNITFESDLKDDGTRVFTKSHQPNIKHSINGRKLCGNSLLNHGLKWGESNLRFLDRGEIFRTGSLKIATFFFQIPFLSPPIYVLIGRSSIF